MRQTVQLQYSTVENSKGEKETYVGLAECRKINKGLPDNHECFCITNFQSF